MDRFESWWLDSPPEISVHFELSDPVSMLAKRPESGWLLPRCEQED